MGWRAGVAAATAVFVLTLAAVPLYVSSSATAAYDAQLASVCAADAGFSIAAQVSPHLDTVFFRQLDDSLASEHLLQPAITTRVTPVVNLVPSLAPGTLYRQVRLVHRPEQQDHLHIVRGAYDPNGVLIPDYFATALGLAPGATLHLLNGQTQVEATLSGTYDTVPTDPTPSYWCGVADLFRPNQFGDPPLPVLIAPDRLLTDVMPVKDGFLTTVLERRLVTGSGTVADATRLAGDVQRTLDEAEPGVPPGPGGVSRFQAHWDLAATVRRAREVSTVVRRNVLPVQVVGVVAGAIVLTSTGLLVARRRRKELRVLAVRGMQLPAVGLRVAGAVTPPAIVGAVVGLGAAVLIVRGLGPSTRIETAAYRHAAFLCVAALLAAIAIIAVVTVGAARHALDRRAHHRAWYARVPWELVLVGLAVIAFFRLDEAGGVRLVGAQADRGDLLGQMFPLLAVAAAIAVLVRLLVLVLRRLHRAGRTLPPATLLGLRRTTADAASTAGVVAATAFAIAAWCTAVILTDSTTAALRDKAGTFVGADEAIRTSDATSLPRELQGRATIVSRQLARSGEYPVDVVGIDPATFRDGAHVTSTIAPRLLEEITRPVAAGEPIPVIVVGRQLDENVLGTQQRDETKVPVEVVGRLPSFPGYNNGSSLVVMSRDALSGSPLGSYQEVWIRDPQPTDPKALTDSGTAVYATSVASDIFDVTSFLALRWSFDATKAFGVLVGSVIVAVLLLVLDARSRARQATYLLAVRMGLRPREHLWALLIELGVPLLGGFALGVVLAVASTRLSVARLDSLRNLQPPARQVVQLGQMSGGLLVVVAIVVGLAAWGQAITARGRPEEVLRATE